MSGAVVTPERASMRRSADMPPMCILQEREGPDWLGILL
jgi:hypothetical protein